MAIISSNINESNSSRSNRELRIVKSEIIPEDKLDSQLIANRPTNFQEFIGHEKLKSSLRISIEASLYRKECLEHALFYGQPGLGKTTLALLLANEMNTKCKVINASSIERPRDIVGLLLGLKDNEILFIDEIHRLNNLTEEILYPAMEDFKLDLTVGANRGTRCRTINLPKFTLIGATTKLASISNPLRDRFGIIHKINLYSPEDLQDIIFNFSNRINIKIDKLTSLRLALCSRGTPRIALRLLKRSRDYAQVIDKNNIVSAEIVEKVLDNQKIDDKGLDEMDRNFLFYLFQNNNGPVGLDSIAAALIEDSAMLECIVEPYLIQLGFIARTPRGRVLTPLGALYVNECNIKET
tara:strand:+ start:674 stop:1735 length:1062 start_codon:yes stop_codon:yes gene_type:complete